MQALRPIALVSVIWSWTVTAADGKRPLLWQRRAEGAASEENARQQGVALLEVSGRVSEPVDADMFGSFSEGESTYDDEADGKLRLSEGEVVNFHDSTEVRPDNPLSRGIKVPVWFHESSSDAGNQAWQTHFPALTEHQAAGTYGLGEWHMDVNGQWNQDYLESSFSGATPLGVKDARWFDNSVQQVDGFGRVKAPSSSSVKSLISFTERAVNSSLTCVKPGCQGQTTMQLFDATTELAQNCRLDLHLHPTDFDDEYSGERLEFVRINGVTVNSDCFPMISGCNESSQRPLYPCFRDLLLDSFIGANGTISIEAKIPDIVDECPYQGNLLSGVPIVTCMVKQKTSPPPERPPPHGKPAFPTLTLPPWPKFVYAKAPLRCPERGCTAHAHLLQMNKTADISFSKCLMNVVVRQTDFDQEEGTVEQIEWININGQTVKTNMTPGKNPCRSRWKGQQLSLAETEMVAVSSFDVTANATKNFTVSAKISPHVDECASEGYLLNGYVEVNCTVVPLAANVSYPILLQEEEQVDASDLLPTERQHGNLRHALPA
mmetsp:Transcript_29228/g.63554  ORF Transcript_29228/g.63554 Transcript_29228/m.63554 type:complete len:548 (-) Transcript_29228:106-1749(-)